jgi:hypothetical protein
MVLGKDTRQLLRIQEDWKRKNTLIGIQLATNVQKRKKKKSKKNKSKASKTVKKLAGSEKYETKNK